MSVLCTSYARPELLARALSSVQLQSYANYECLVLDDGTPGGVGWLVEALADSRFTCYESWPSRVERGATTRYATLINHGAALAKGQYLTYLCDDDWYYPNRLERMVGRLEEGDAEVVYGAQVLRYGEGRPDGLRPADEVLIDAWHRVDQNSVMHTRAAFDRVGGWDDDPRWWDMADAVFWRRLTDAGYKFYPVTGGPTDVKNYHVNSVDVKFKGGREPWS